MSVLRGDDPAALAAAAERLADGGLVAFPTETVYGLGARADRDEAVAAVFAAKGRPADHPLIVHVADRVAATSFAAHWPPAAQRLAEAFWPGPVTVIVPRAAGIGAAAAAGQRTIGLRCPAHPVALALLRAAALRGVAGLAAPSANRFGRVSPTRAAHVADEFGGALWVLDGGDCALGIESTIVDTSRGRPVLLRPGVLDRRALERALGEPLHEADAAAPRSPGSLASHYAPAARLRLFAPAALQQRLADPSRVPQGVAVYSPQPPEGMLARWRWRALPDDPAAAAHELFAVLRAFDAEGVREIWVQQPPALPAWDGVLDRLRRAAAS